MTPIVAGPALTPVKGTRPQSVDSIDLKRSGAGGYDEVDSRRFRMLVEVEGVDAHGEDEWVGRRLRIGNRSVVRFEGHVGRCLITSRDPVTGVIDLPTLDILASYRRDLDTTEALPFGIYGRVLEPGEIRMGDGLALGG